MTKRLLPSAWLGVLVLFVAIAIASVGPSAGLWALLVVALAAAVGGFVMIRKLVCDLADEVHDCGDHLLVTFGHEQQRIPLDDIMNVNAQLNLKPARITLRLVTPGKFGSEVSFSPPTRASLDPFAKNEVAEDLIVRVHRARSARRR